MIRHKLAAPALLATRAIRAFRRPEKGFRVLLFHHVPIESVRAFECLIDHVQAVHGIMTPEDAQKFFTRAPLDASVSDHNLPCLISFDDGFNSNYELAVSVLEKRGIKSLFFVCPGLLDLSEEQQREAIAARIFDGRCHAGALDPKLKFMNWDKVQDLCARGHSVGCHGLEHRRLSELSNAELEKEILVGADLLEKRLGHAPTWYAYAFGDIESVSSPALQLIGTRFEFCRSGVRGANSRTTQRLGIHGDEIDVAAPKSYQKLVVEGGLDFHYREARKRLSSMARSDGISC